MPRHREQTAFAVVIVGIGRDTEIVLLGEETLVGRTKIGRVLSRCSCPRRSSSLDGTATRHLTIGRGGSDLLALIEHVVKSEDSIQLHPLEGTEVSTQLAPKRTSFVQRRNCPVRSLYLRPG